MNQGMWNVNVGLCWKSIMQHLLLVKVYILPSFQQAPGGTGACPLDPHKELCKIDQHTWLAQGHNWLKVTGWDSWLSQTKKQHPRSPNPAHGSLHHTGPQALHGDMAVLLLVHPDVSDIIDWIWLLMQLTGAYWSYSKRKPTPTSIVQAALYAPLQKQVNFSLGGLLRSNHSGWLWIAHV